jgi:hypothetical protein
MIVPAERGDFLSHSESNAPQEAAA